MSIFERIRQVRERTGLGQKEFAERVGVSKNTQLRYENGQSYPAVDYLERVASKYGIDGNWLMTGYQATEAERLNIARHQVLGGIAAELGVSNEQVGLLIDLAFEGNPEWVEMARSMVVKRMLAALSPAEQAIIEAYRSADETGKKTLEMTATLAKGSRA
jgi:transcriptional regulator with XRE-family HTH domain